MFMKRCTAILALCAMTVACSSCVPWLVNVAARETVPTVVGAELASDDQLVVLPLWSDSESCNFRSPFVISASDIGTSEAASRRDGVSS